MGSVLNVQLVSVMKFAERHTTRYEKVFFDKKHITEVNRNLLYHMTRRHTLRCKLEIVICDYQFTVHKERPCTEFLTPFYVEPGLERVGIQNTVGLGS